MNAKLSPPLPRFVQIEPVGQCNLRCQMCPVSWREDVPTTGPHAFIAIEDFLRLLDGFPDIEELQLQGLGEPLLHPHFFTLVQLAVDRSIRVSTNSNLTVLTRRRARACVASGLDTLHCSIDGATARTYESIRKRSNFTKVLRNLAQLIAIKREMGSATPRLRIVVVAMRRNLAEIPGIVVLAYSLGIPEVFVQHLCHDYGDVARSLAHQEMREFVERETLLGEDPGRVNEHFEAAVQLAGDLGVELRLPELQPRRRRNPRGCDWPHEGAYLSYRGEAMPCCMVGTPQRATLGNMAEAGVAAVWHGPAYRDFRAALASPEPPDICRGCGVYRGTF